MSESNTQTWLLNYEILRLVNQCRRLLDAEFGEKPLLSNHRIWQVLADLAGRSRSRGTQRVYAELRLALLKVDDIDWPESHRPVAQGVTTHARMYRGRPVNKPAVSAVEKAESGERSAVTSRTITYRGHTIEVA